jgi:hypothetical protein
METSSVLKSTKRAEPESFSISARYKIALTHPLKRFGHPKANTSILERAISIVIFFRPSKVFFAFALTMLTAKSLVADPVPVRRTQGTFHGFLVLKTQEGKTIATGDLIQVAQADRVTARMSFKFRDGSIDDETTVFSQDKVFRLISDHHIQRGPSFPHPLDMLVDAASGDVTYHDKDGKAAEDHLDLPADICNGLPLTLLLNLDPTGPPVRLAMVAPTAKPRLIHVVMAADGDGPLSIGGIRQKATNYQIKIELGGVEGVVAPIIGKQPSDIHVWVLGGEAPAFVREEGQFYEGGPVWRIELVAPVFPRAR